MFKLNVWNMSFDEGLQLVQADVQLEIDGEMIVDETCCIDVGLPSFLRSVLSDMEPYRWAPAEQWMKMPFFICGCGDAECKAFSFLVRHEENRIKLTEVEERQDGSYRAYQEFSVDKTEYEQSAVQFAQQFLHFVNPLDYKPYFADTVPIIKDLLTKIEDRKRID